MHDVNISPPIQSFVVLIFAATDLSAKTAKFCTMRKISRYTVNPASTKTLIVMPHALLNTTLSPSSSEDQAQGQGYKYKTSVHICDDRYCQSKHYCELTSNYLKGNCLIGSAGIVAELCNETVRPNFIKHHGFQDKGLVGHIFTARFKSFLAGNWTLCYSHIPTCFDRKSISVCM